MKTVYIVYHDWYSEWTREIQQSVDAIFESLEEAKIYVNEQYRPSEYEIEEFYSYYEEGYKG